MTELADLEPQLSGEWFVFLDDRRRVFKMAADPSAGVWRLFAFPVEPCVRWKFLRTLTPFDALRMRLRALPAKDAQRYDDRTAG